MSFLNAFKKSKKPKTSESKPVKSGSCWEANDTLSRIKVIGGWLVRDNYKGSLCFVPDPNNKWRL